MSLAGIKAVEVDLSNEQVIVETSLPSGKVQDLLEQTGKTAIFRGHGYKKGVPIMLFILWAAYFLNGGSLGP